MVPDVEIVYEAPAAPRRWMAGAAVFVLAVLWVTLRSLRGPRWFAAAAALCAVIYGVQALLGRATVLATRRVALVDGGRALRIEHRRGVRVVDLASVASVEAGTQVLPDGVTLDVVTVSVRDGAPLTFSVATAGAAEGAARAVRAASTASEAGHSL